MKEKSRLCVGTEFTSSMREDFMSTPTESTMLWVSPSWEIMAITLHGHFYGYYTIRSFLWLLHCPAISMAITLHSLFYDYYTARPSQWLLHYTVISMTITLPGHFNGYYTTWSFLWLLQCPVISMTITLKIHSLSSESASFCSLAS